MPTGYTEAIGKGITFEEFAMRCSRAFGALVSMRDDNSNAPIPNEFEPSTHHAQAIANERQTLANIRSLTLEETNAEADKVYRDECVHRKEASEKNDILMVAYRSMLQDVLNWIPPTPDHEELKKFMMSQIEESIKFDSMSDFHDKYPIIKTTGAEWRDKKIASSIRSLEYHTEENEKEIERASSKTKWIQDLRKSLVCARLGTTYCDICEKRFVCYTRKGIL